MKKTLTLSLLSLACSFSFAQTLKQHVEVGNLNGNTIQTTTIVLQDSNGKATHTDILVLMKDDLNTKYFIDVNVEENKNGKKTNQKFNLSLFPNTSTCALTYTQNPVLVSFNHNPKNNHTSFDIGNVSENLNLFFAISKNKGDVKVSYGYSNTVINSLDQVKTKDNQGFVDIPKLTTTQAYSFENPLSLDKNYYMVENKDLKISFTIKEIKN